MNVGDTGGGGGGYGVVSISYGFMFICLLAVCRLCFSDRGQVAS